MHPSGSLLTVLFLFQACGALASNRSLIIKLNHGGSLKGIELKTETGRSIRSFLGIPYAKAPVGELRFMSPVPYPGWKGQRSATEDGSSCTQAFALLADQGSEDCLFLNVYTPPPENITNSGLSVMVWYHGGAWFAGSNNHLFYGPEYILDHDIILVTVNYRLGALGFLSSETLDCPGNFGLKDQVEALRWVKEHISSFGGNPNNVTIFGESAGGASVSYLLQSDKPKGLFHKAIQQSGTIFNFWAQPLHRGVAKGRALKLAKIFSCHNSEENWKEIIECLRKVDATEMISKTKDLTEWNGYPYFIFQPVVEPQHDEAFIIDRPRDVTLGSLNIPLLTGITSGEGLLSTVPILRNEEILKELKQTVQEKFPLMMSYDHWDKKKQNEITKAFEEFYFKNGHDYGNMRHKNFTDMFSDSLFVAGFDEYLEKRLADDAAPTFVYLYDFKSKSFMSKLMGGDDFEGVGHGEDVKMLFPINKHFKLPPDSTEKFPLMRDAMVQMWVNFANFGNPTPEEKLPKWEPTTKYPWNYAHLGGIDESGFFVLKNAKGYARDRLELWKKLRPHRENDMNGQSDVFS